MELTRAKIIEQDKISEQSFLQKATALEDQSAALLEEAEKSRNAARIAREHWQELESTHEPL